MALSIEDDETDGPVRPLAAARRPSYTAAIKLAVGNGLARVEPRRPIDRHALARSRERWIEHGPIDLTEADAWMYDENGLPRRAP